MKTHILKLFRSFLVIAFFYASCAAMVAAAVNPEIFTAPGVIGAGLFGTAAGGIGVAFSFNLTYLPEWLHFNHAGNQLTSLLVRTEKGVILDLAALGLTAVNGYGKKGTMTANDMSIRLADGVLPGHSVTISGVTSAVGAINFYENSDSYGTTSFKYDTATILAATVTKFDKFTAIWTPTMATLTDYVEVVFDDNHNQRYEIEELRSLSSEFQQVEAIMLNNIAGNMRRASYRCAAATLAYIMSVDTSLKL